MGDRLTQLQEAVNLQADNLCNSIGIIQQHPVRVSAEDEDHTILFSKLIARTAKDIELLVESLPSENSTPDLQSVSISQLERDSEVAEEHLFRTVEHGEQVLQGLQVALKDIASQLLEIERISAEDEMKVGSDNFVLQ